MRIGLLIIQSFITVSFAFVQKADSLSYDIKEFTLAGKWIMIENSDTLIMSFEKNQTFYWEVNSTGNKSNCGEWKLSQEGIKIYLGDNCGVYQFECYGDPESFSIKYSIINDSILLFYFPNKSESTTVIRQE